MKNRAPKDLLKWTAAGFALVATATAEYEIARAIGMNEWIAAAVPGALDAYVVRALRTHREVLTSVVAMVGVNAASHLVTAGILPVEWPLITAVSAIAPLVLWRVHALGTPGEARRRVLWGLPWRARPAEHTSTEEWSRVRDGHGVTIGFETPSTEPEHTEHDRVPDNPEPPGTREHPEHIDGGMPYLCPYGCTVWGDVEAHERAHEHAGWEGEHAPSTLDLDVPDWVNPPSTPPLPVHAPYADHVLTPSTVCENCGHAGHGEHRHDGRAWAHDALRDCPECSCAQELREMCGYCADAEHASTGPVLLPFLPSTQPVRTRHLEIVKDPGELDDRDGVTGYVNETEHTASTRTADDWNLEHVAKGVLTPEDTEHMERARELFHTIGGVPPFRALKHGTPGMGTDRAKRIRAALKAEAEGTD